MTTALRTLAFAAATAAGLAAGPAAAWDDRLPLAAPPLARPDPAYTTLAYPAPAYANPATAIPPQAGHAPAPGWWAPPAHDAPWSSWEARELLREYRQLDWARARFHRRFGWNPWRVARFDAWYGWRRAELDRRWAELDRRDEPRHGWPGREARWHRDRFDD